MAVRPMTIPADAPAPVGGFRSDIQGLRAIAVTAVVADHLVGWPAGGFVGVDVFFVISGFLITGLLLREHDLHGRVSWSDFYRRRARRILPAALVCLVLVVAASSLVYRAARAETITVDAFWSALFVANWHFAAVGTDYLGAITPTSPLQHFWSLAVEEQFYLLWPIVLGIILATTARRSGKRGGGGRVVLIAVLIAVVVGSFGWSVAETASAPTWGYFSTLSRGWEIAAGALLAVIAGRLTRLSPGLRSAMSLGGLGLIAAGLFLLHPRMAVPGPWSAVPVAGALLVLAAGVGSRLPSSRLLTNRGARYVGRISYSLYLWHFPVIVLLAALLPDGPMTVAVTAVVIVALSVISFHLIEQPMQRGVRAARMIPTRRTGSVPARMAGVTAVITAVLVTVAALAHGGRDPAGEDGTLAAGAMVNSTVPDDPRARLNAELDAALRADEWPALTPAIDGLSETGRPPNDRECATGLVDRRDEPGTPDGTVGSTDPGFAPPVRLTGDAANCAFGDPAAPRLAVVAGDSIAITWIPLVQELLAAQGYRIQGLTMSGCPLVGTETRNVAANITALCPAHKAAVVEAIRRMKPDIVFISNTYRAWMRGLPDGDTGATRYAEGQRSVIEEFEASVGAVYVLAPPPPGKALEDCATTLSTPVDCVSTVPDDWRLFNTAMSDHLNEMSTTRYVDTSSWFCTTDDRRCPSFVGHSPVQRDGTGHIVPAYAKRLAPLLGQILAARHGP